MKRQIDRWLNCYYPQSYILRNPLRGILIISLFVFAFTSLYKPFNVHATRVLSFEMTMAVYSFLSGIFMYLVVKILKIPEYFSNDKEWTFLKEIIFVLIILSSLGVAIYFLGFLIETEPSASRWNISTFLNSMGSAFLIGIIPLFFFTTINYRYLFSPVSGQSTGPYTVAENENRQPEDLIQISSRLKKEELNFYANEFIYAESDGNYVIFYLIKNGVVKKEMIRNSINSIEQQLSHLPCFLRIHRAFIVNLNKVISKQGNTLGYLIKLAGTESRIPVSRNNTEKFNCLFVRFHSS
jgi:hypothetical protein